MARVLGNPNQEFELLKEAARKARLPFDRETSLNLAYFMGRQYVQWDGENAYLKGLARTEGSERAPRPIVNKIRHMVQEAHSKAIANRPYPDVLPATDEPSDVSDASVCLAFVKWLADDAVGDYDSELSEEVWWALLGEGYMKWTYDPELERPVFEAVSPFDLYSDAYARRFKGARWALHSQYMDVEQVEDVYGEKIPPTRMDQADMERSAIMRDMGHSPVTQGGAVVNELWLKPGVSRKHPDGLFTVWSGKKTLIPPSPFPYNHGMLPFTQIGSIRLMGTKHYTSFVTDERKPQAELNKYHQQSVMNRESFGNPKWWIADELELQADPDDSPNQILRGSGAAGLQPEILQPATMAYSEDGRWLTEEMMDVAGLHEVSRAQVPGRVEAARAIEQLQQQDDSRLTELLKRIRVQTAVGFWQCIMLADQYMPADKIATVYSEEGTPEVKQFKIKNINPSLRIKVTMGTGLTESRAARVDAALNMWREGIVTDPEVMAEILEIPVGKIAPQRAFDIRLARNENLTITAKDPEGEDGTAIMPNSWDEHAVHIREHNNYRKTGDYQMQPDDVKRKFEFHVQLHEIMELRKLQKEAEKQAVLGMIAPAEATTEAGEGAAQGAALGPTGEAASPTADPNASRPSEAPGGVATQTGAPPTEGP